MKIPTAPKYVKDVPYFKTKDPNGTVWRFWEHAQEGTWKFCIDDPKPFYVFTVDTKEEALSIIGSK